jgi:hypothetical protein
MIGIEGVGLSFLSPDVESSLLLIVFIVGPKLFIEPGTKAFFWLSSVSGPGL